MSFGEVFKRFTFIVFWIFLLVFLSAQVSRLGVLVSDGDTVEGFAYKLEFPDDSLTLSGAVGTYDGSVEPGGTVALDDVTDPDANTDIIVGTYTVKLDGTAGDWYFNDGDVTIGGAFESTGSEVRLLCTQAGTASLTEAGETCFNSSTNRWEYWDPSAGGSGDKEQVVGEDASATLINKAIDATDGTNTLTITEEYCLPLCTRAFPVGHNTNGDIDHNPFEDADTTDPRCIQESSSVVTRNMMRVFDGGTDETVELDWVPPSDITGSTFKARLTGYIPDTGRTGSVTEDNTGLWDISANCVGDQAPHAAGGTSQTITWTAGAGAAEDDRIVTGWSSAITPSGTLGGTAVCRMIVQRNADTDTDTEDLGIDKLCVRYEREVGAF